MCGRYARKRDKQAIAEAFHAGMLDELYLEAAPSYNVAPSTNQPVIVADSDSGDRWLRIMRWGLIPTWVKSLKEMKRTTINAKAEDIEAKPLWRKPFESRRCLVPADLFYEWKKLDAKTKQPYAFSMADDSMVAFAGIWSRWKGDGQTIDSYSIITTEPNELTSTVHNRMPVIVQPKDYDRWLLPQDRSPVDRLRPYDPDAMRAWMVDPRVGNVRNNEAGLCLAWE